VKRRSFLGGDGKDKMQVEVIMLEDGGVVEVRKLLVIKTGHDRLRDIADAVIEETARAYVGDEHVSESVSERLSALFE